MLEFPHNLVTLLSSGYSERYTDKLIRTQMDSGREKVRRNNCKAEKIYNLSYHICSCDSKIEFQRWYVEDASEGAKCFKWQEPCTTNFLLARLAGPPEFSSNNDMLTSWTVQIQIKVYE